MVSWDDPLRLHGVLHLRCDVVSWDDLLRLHGVLQQLKLVQGLGALPWVF